MKRVLTTLFTLTTLISPAYAEVVSIDIGNFEGAEQEIAAAIQRYNNANGNIIGPEYLNYLGECNVVIDSSLPLGPVEGQIICAELNNLRVTFAMVGSAKKAAVPQPKDTCTRFNMLSRTSKGGRFSITCSDKHLRGNITLKVTR